MLDSSQLTLFEPKVTTSEIRHDLFNHLIKQYLPKVIATLKGKTVSDITVSFTDDGVYFRKVKGEETKMVIGGMCYLLNKLKIHISEKQMIKR